MHNSSKLHAGQWTQKYGHTDTLLLHILNDKAGLVRSKAFDREVVRRVSDAATYLKSQCSLLAGGNTLSHLDFSLANIQTDNSGEFYGLLD
jgi:hypothetical protein